MMALVPKVRLLWAHSLHDDAAFVRRPCVWRDGLLMLTRSRGHPHYR